MRIYPNLDIITTVNETAGKPSLPGVNEIIFTKEEIYSLWIRVPRDERRMGSKGLQKMASRRFSRKFHESLTHALCADSSTEGGRRLNVPEFHKEEVDLRANC
jgi:hypothetical protein